jgi:hypothetical protein
VVAELYLVAFLPPILVGLIEICFLIFEIFFIGTDITFRAYGVICLILMCVFIYLNYRYQKQQNEQQMMSGQPRRLTADDPHQFIGNSPLLAPHGAPANPKWQTKFSSGLTGGIRQDQLYSSPTPIPKGVRF